MQGRIYELVNPRTQDQRAIDGQRDAYANIGLALASYKQIAETFAPEIDVFANFPSLFMASSMKTSQSSSPTAHFA